MVTRGLVRSALGRWLRTAVAAPALTGAACQATDIVTPHGDEPFLYLVLQPDLATMPVERDVYPQFAVLKTTVSPLLAECRTAERFEMRPATGGPPFAWRSGQPYANCSALHAYESARVWANANYHLPATVPGDSAGAAHLDHNARYLLYVETEGRTIRGEAVIPDTFTVSITGRTGERMLVWPRVAGAGGYAVSFDTGDETVQPDTFLAVPPRADYASVRALDENLYRYMSDGRVGRAGIEGAYGVFGALSFDDIEF